MENTRECSECGFEFDLQALKECPACLSLVCSSCWDEHEEYCAAGYADDDIEYDYNDLEDSDESKDEEE